MKAIIGFLVERGLVVNLISIFLVALGLATAVLINREAFPNVNLDRIQVDIVYPGANPEEVERLTITPIEQELKALNGIDKMTSVAFPGSGRIVLELDPEASNRARLASDTQLAIDRATLPADLPEQPRVLEIDGSVIPIIQVAVSAPLTPLELKRLGDRLRDDLLEIEGVARVAVQGERKAEIRVVVDPDALRRHRVGIGEVAATLRNWNINAPGGDIDTDEGQQAVRIVGEFDSAEDAANVMLRANERGGGIRLGDIARVVETLEEPRRVYDVEGKPALALIVLKKSDADIIATVDRVRAYLDTVPERYGAGIEVAPFQDFSSFARLRLGVLTNNGMVGLALVFISLILFLRPSVALTTTWGLPIVFLTGLFGLYASGITLNLLSMMGFIIVLGMLVDDAIIVGENITYHMEQGMAPRPAAVRGAVELMGPVTATVMTTVVAFAPMFFLSGIIGKFIVAIPAVVITLLLLSWLESFLILPSHVAHVTNPNKHPRERAWLRALENIYAWVLRWALRLRWLTVLLSFGLLGGSIYLALTHMSFELFPARGVDQFIVRVTAPPGTSIERMRGYLTDVDREIRTRIRPEHLETTLVVSGEIAVDDGDPLTQRGGRFGQIRAVYIPEVLRPGHSALDDMQRLARELPQLFPEFDIALSEIKPGPPVGRPLEVEITGPDPVANEAAARRLIAFLDDVPGVTNVDSGLLPGDEELHIVVNRPVAAYAGIDLSTIAQHVRAAVGGLVVSTTRRGTEEIDVTIRYPEGEDIDQVKQLKQLLVPNQRGGLVPLHKIATLEQQPGFTAIRHKSGVRVVNVAADINAEKITSVEVNRLVAANEQTWLGGERTRVAVNYGGEAEKNRESAVDLAIAFAFALVAIFFILAIQFNNLSYPLIVMLAIPFGAIGIILAFYLHDLYWQPMPLSFLSMLGMVALTGVVVNSALVLLVFVQRARRDGMEMLEAIVLAGRRRLRAVILTAATTVAGLLPTAYGWGGMDPFVSPMALALAWGLAFGTGITLITIPATLAVAADVKRGFLALGRGLRRLRHRTS